MWPSAGTDLRFNEIRDKARFGAFVPGTSGLEAILNECGIDTLIITGTATNMCREMTAREAMQGCGRAQLPNHWRPRQKTMYMLAPE